MASNALFGCAIRNFTKRCAPEYLDGEKSFTES